MNLFYEKQKWQKGFSFVAGIDEAGRGPLAGPVIAASVAVKKSAKLPKSFLEQINDSKLLSPRKRQGLYLKLTNLEGIFWGEGRVGPKLIDRINILEASRLAMKRAFLNLIKKTGKKPDFVFIDGPLSIETKVSQQGIVAADQKIFCVASASIIAKVRRDKLMSYYDKKFPGYCFGKHMGYPTKLHRRLLKKNGPCPIHRLSFALFPRPNQAKSPTKKK